jgi:hypothetical protein
MEWTAEQQRRESWIYGNWNPTDDDTPRPPEPSPLSSAQSRRAWSLEVVGAEPQK